MDGKNTAGSYSALVVLETGAPFAGAFYMLPQYRAALDVRQGARVSPSTHGFRARVRVRCRFRSLLMTCRSRWRTWLASAALVHVLACRAPHCRSAADIVTSAWAVPMKLGDLGVQAMPACAAYGLADTRIATRRMC